MSKLFTKINYFFKKFKYVIISFLFLVIVIISFINYQNTKEIIKNKYIEQQEFVENSILKTVTHLSDAYKIAEQQLNQEMRQYSLMLKYKYNRNPDVASWDLGRLKKQLGAYNFYIINSDLQVIRSTFKEDIGLDFSKYPGFSKLLKERMQGNKFVVDRLDISTKTGEIKKYSYMPTPDHQYLLELSIDVKEKFPVLKRLDIFADAVNITKKYDSVEEISFYKYNPNRETVGELRNTKKPYMNTNVSQLEHRLVERAFLSQEEQKSTAGITEANYINRFIPLLISDTNGSDKWWNSFVIGIKYNNKNMLAEIQEHRTLFVINALIMIVVFIAFILVVMHLLQRFEYLAYHDQLTGLPNRDSFVDKINNLMAKAEHEDNKIAVLFLDIDDFKSVNDNYGHDTGDKLLEGTAQRLRKSLRKKDIVSRMGGDEFAIAVADIDTENELNKVADRVLAGFDSPISVEDKKFSISVSLGVSLYPDDGSHLEELIKKADYAMYKAKNENKNCVVYNQQILEGESHLDNS